MRILIILLVCVSCTPVATYPPIENKTVENYSKNVNEPVITILATAFEYAFDHFGGMEAIVFNLPRGMSATAYTRVSKKLNGALPMTEVGQPAYHVVELRVRGFSADVDMFFPSASGGYEMATIHLEASLLDKWRVTRDRVWLVPVSEIPTPNDPVLLENE